MVQSPRPQRGEVEGEGCWPTCCACCPSPRISSGIERMVSVVAMVPSRVAAPTFQREIYITSSIINLIGS